MVKGEIYFGKNNHDGRHPMVFLSDIDEDTFNGIMLTHSSMSNNMKLESKHFEWTTKKFDINGTHFVRRKLIKKNEWNPFTLVGKLSKSGIDMANELIKNTNAEYF